jgi:hypothetical protein
VLYIDADDDLSLVLDRVEESGTPAIVVLPEGARSVRGVVAARLLQRRAEAARIDLVAVTTDRTALAQLKAVHIGTAPTVGAARALLSPASAGGAPQAASTPPRGASGDPLDALAWDDATEVADGEDELEDEQLATALAEQFDPVVEDAAGDDEDSDTVATPAGSRVRGGGQRQRPASNKVQRRTAQASTRRALLVLSSLAALLVIGLAVWAFFLPAATLTITYRQGVLDHDFVVPVGSGALAIPTHVGHLSQTLSVEVPGTGSQLVPDQHAHGTITFANPQNVVESVPAGTVVTARSGARFVTTQAVQVPAAVNAFAGTTNGQQSVPVQAEAGGDQGNVPAGSIVGIVGPLGNLLLVTNDAPMTGGTMRTIYSLTVADISAPQSMIRAKLLAMETATLNARYARSPVRRLGPFATDPAAVTRFERDGRPFARIALTMHGQAMYVHESDVDTFVRAQLQAQLSGHNEQLVPGTTVQHLVAIHTPDGTAIRVHVRARTAPIIDVGDLQERLAGRTVDDALVLLQQGAANGGWTYTLSTEPDWAHRMPQVRSLITIHVVQLG